MAMVLLMAMELQNQPNMATWDKVTDDRIKTLHPLIRYSVEKIINILDQNHGIRLRVTSALRTWSEQANLYALGRTKPGKIVTNSQPGDSAHNYGLAPDVVEISDGVAIWNNPKQSIIDDVFTSFEFENGSEWKFKDIPHHQKLFGYTIYELKEKYINDEMDNDRYVLIDINKQGI